MSSPHPRSQSALVTSARPAPHIGLITLDSPPRNAFGRAEVLAFTAVLDELEADESIRAIVLTGTGSSFTAGADLNEQLAVPVGEREAYFRGAGQMTAAISRVAASPLPIIGAINGYALGGGLELAISCDVRIASTRARFVCAAVNVGLILSWHKLPRIIGQGRANEMLLSGSMYDAETAERWGLVSGLYEPDELLPAAVALAERVASRAPLSVRATKRAAARAFELSEPEAAELQWELFLQMSGTHDHREAVQAFLEKRPPKFEAR